MRISDWSSDVCSSDLQQRDGGLLRPAAPGLPGLRLRGSGGEVLRPPRRARRRRRHLGQGRGRPQGRGGGDRKSVVQGTRVSVRVDLGGRRRLKKQRQEKLKRGHYSTPTMKQ